MTLRVLQVNAVTDEGSTGRLCRQLADNLSDHDIYSQIAFSHGTGRRGDFRFGSSLENAIHSLDARASGIQGRGSYFGTGQLIRFIERERFDLVHLHNMHSNNVHLGRLLGYLADTDTPTAITLHDSWFMTGKCTHYARVGCDRWMKSCGDCPQLRRDIPSWMFDRTSQMIRQKRDLFNGIPRLGVVAVSQWMADQARLSHLADAKLIRPIYNWVDLDTFAPKPSQMDRHDLEVVAVASRWTEDKGMLDVVRLAEALHSKRSEVRISLVGEWSASVQLPPNVKLLGTVSDPAHLADIYRGADALVSLSRAESFGLVVAEALATGTPAVVMDTTASRELVPPQCGFRIVPGDIQGVVRALDLIADTSRSAWIDACRSAATSRFSKVDNIARHADFYRALVESDGAFIQEDGIL